MNLTQNEITNMGRIYIDHPERFEDLKAFEKYSGPVIVLKENGITQEIISQPISGNTEKEIEKLQAEKSKLEALVEKYEARHSENFQKRNYKAAEDAETARRQYARSLENVILRLNAAIESRPEKIKQQIVELETYLESIQSSVIAPALEAKKILENQLSEISTKPAKKSAAV